MKKFAALSFVLLLAACNMQQQPDGPAAKRMPVMWTAEDAGMDENGMATTNIMLTTEGDAEMLFATTCNGTASTENLDIEGSIASIQCWLPGGGDQYAVFVGDAEELTIMHRTVDEEAGFGEWEEISVQ